MHDRTHPTLLSSHLLYVSRPDIVAFAEDEANQSLCLFAIRNAGDTCTDLGTSPKRQLSDPLGSGLD